MEAVVSAWRKEQPVVSVHEPVQVYETKLPSIALQLRVLFGKASRLLVLQRRQRVPSSAIQRPSRRAAPGCL